MAYLGLDRELELGSSGPWWLDELRTTEHESVVEEHPTVPVIRRGGAHMRVSYHQGSHVGVLIRRAALGFPCS